MRLVPAEREEEDMMAFDDDCKWVWNRKVRGRICVLICLDRACTEYEGLVWCRCWWEVFAA